MPSNSTSIFQEGASFVSFKLVAEGVFQEEELIKMFQLPGRYPGCSGSRALMDNISDLKAQIAANNKGVHLVTDLIRHYGLEVVQAYMSYIQQNAELEVRDLMKLLMKKYQTNIFSADDMMDDGTTINLVIIVNPSDGSATFDFSGTGEEVFGNCNAPTSVTYSAIIYSLRCLIGHDVPLNHGFLLPIDVVFPPSSIISPSKSAAVVGGLLIFS